MQFLQLLETIASNLDATNLENFITLTDNLISLGEAVLEHKSAASSTASTNSNPPAQS